MTTIHKPHFYDSADSHSVPSGVRAAVYVNGAFVWERSEVRRMGKTIGVSVERAAHWARWARVLDIENGAARDSDWVPFARERAHLGFNDATAYVNRANISDVHALTLEAALPFAFYWVATLDGTPHGPTFDVADGVVDAWAEQYSGGMHAPFDVSILYGADTFHRP